MPKLTRRVPKYGLHKASGQALVKLGGKAFYLGQDGTKTSRRKYEQLVGQWIANGRKLPGEEMRPVCRSLESIPPVPRGEDLLVLNLVGAYWRYAHEYYQGHEKELNFIKQCLKPLRKQCRNMQAVSFGPKALKELRESLINQTGNSRGTINRKVNHIVEVFRWAVESEMLPAAVYQALQSVRGLKKGRSKAYETKPVKPVSQELVNTVLHHVSRPIAAMIRLQWLTGMRSSEVLTMRSCDIDRNGEVWLYRPQHHKTEHHDIERVIDLGPKAQKILQPFLDRCDPAGFLFNPKEAERERLARLHAQRKTPLSCGNRPGTNRPKRPRRVLGDRYSPESYRRAIQRACDKASRKAWIDQHGQESLESEEYRAFQITRRWHPHQLRHSAATRIRKEFGIEAVRAVLGHGTIKTTETYAERDRQLVRKIISQIG